MAGHEDYSDALNSKYRLVDVPLYIATEENIADYGRFVRDFEQEEVRHHSCQLQDHIAVIIHLLQTTPQKQTLILQAHNSMPKTPLINTQFTTAILCEANEILYNTYPPQLYNTSQHGEDSGNAIHWWMNEQHTSVNTRCGWSRGQCTVSAHCTPARARRETSFRGASRTTGTVIYVNKPTSHAQTATTHSVVWQLRHHLATETTCCAEVWTITLMADRCFIRLPEMHSSCCWHYPVMTSNWKTLWLSISMDRAVCKSRQVNTITTL